MYEVEKREFLSRVYLANQILLSTKDILSIKIFQHTELSKIAIYGKPGIVFLKSAPDPLYPYIRLLKKRGFKIILFQEEGIHYQKNQGKSFEFSSRCSEYIDQYLAWHRDDADFAKKMSIPEDKILVVGNIRFELASKFNVVETKTPANVLGILVLENFTTRNMYRYYKPKRSSVISKVEKNQFIDNNLTHEANIDLNSAIYQHLYRELILKGYDFKIRRYTLGKTDKISDSLEKYIDKSSNILESLSGKNIVIHYGSTAGLEAILNKCVSIIFESPQVKISDSKIRNCSMKFTDLSLLLDFLERLDFNQLAEINHSQINAMNLQYGEQFDKDQTSAVIMSLMKNSTMSNTRYPLISFYWFYAIFYSIKLFLVKIRFRLIALYHSKVFGIANMRVIKANKITYDLVNSSLKLLKTDSLNFEYKIKRNRKSIIINN